MGIAGYLENQALVVTWLCRAPAAKKQNFLSNFQTWTRSVLHGNARLFINFCMFTSSHNKHENYTPWKRSVIRYMKLVVYIRWRNWCCKMWYKCAMSPLYNIHTRVSYWGRDNPPKLKHTCIWFERLHATVFTVYNTLNNNKIHHIKAQSSIFSGGMPT